MTHRHYNTFLFVYSSETCAESMVKSTASPHKSACFTQVQKLIHNPTWNAQGLNRAYSSLEVSSLVACLLDALNSQTELLYNRLENDSIRILGTLSSIRSIDGFMGRGFTSEGQKSFSAAVCKIG